MENLWQQFVQERVYLKNVSPSTARWYRWVEGAFTPYLSEYCASGGTCKQVFKQAVMRLHEKGLEPISIAGYIRGLNAFLRWGYQEGHFKELVVVPKPKCEVKLMATFTPDQVQRLLTWKPSCPSGHRLSALVCLLLDTGMRISEALGLCREDVDLDSLLLKVKGKGGKHRQVPMSFELRKILYRHLQKHSFPWVFGTRSGTRPTRRNITRDFYNLCDRLKMPRRGFHALRHTFALNYLRRGGSTFHLQKILGHSTLEMTRRYCNLMTEDLQAVHQNLSLLNGR